jgi:hypothetical protein
MPPTYEMMCWCIALARQFLSESERRRMGREEIDQLIKEDPFYEGEMAETNSSNFGR